MKSATAQPPESIPQTSMLAMGMDPGLALYLHVGLFIQHPQLPPWQWRPYSLVDWILDALAF